MVVGMNPSIPIPAMIKMLDKDATANEKSPLHFNQLFLEIKYYVILITNRLFVNSRTQMTNCRRLLPILLQIKFVSLQFC
jgi:hypothetical protein